MANSNYNGRYNTEEVMKGIRAQRQASVKQIKERTKLVPPKKEKPVAI